MLRRAEDLWERAARSQSVTHTNFLTPAERYQLENWAKRSGARLLFSGGGPDCERTAAFFLPDWLEEDAFDPGDYISAMKITAYFGTPGHRDYLGAILGMGVGREWLGDLRVEGDTAWLFCMPSVLRHLLSIEKAGRVSVKAEELSIGQVPAPVRQVKQESFSVMSLRLDAVKHISFPFYRALLKDIRKETGLALPAVGEYWSGELSRLLYYLDMVDNEMSLFDVALHYSIFDVSQGRKSLGKVFENTLVGSRPYNAVTFVDNHDTQYGQSLQSFVDDWFKPLAYGLILLRQDGIPCVFYSDYYGNPARNRPLVPNLGKLIKLRHSYAYGEQTDYFEDEHLIGWVRRGDPSHPDSGLAVVMSDNGPGALRMELGPRHIGKTFRDALGNCPEPIVIGEDGFGVFSSSARSVSVWVRDGAFENIVINE